MYLALPDPSFSCHRTKFRALCGPHRVHHFWFGIKTRTHTQMRGTLVPGFAQFHAVRPLPWKSTCMGLLLSRVIMVLSTTLYIHSRCTENIFMYWSLPYEPNHHCTIAVCIQVRTTADYVDVSMLRVWARRLRWIFWDILGYSGILYTV